MKSALLLAVLCTGCTIAPYDAATDAGLTSLQRKVDGRVAALGQSTNVTFYQDLTVDLRMVETRLAARQNGDPSVSAELAAVKELEPMLVDMKKLEATAAAPMGVAQQEIDTAIGGVLSLELRRPR